MKMQKVCPLCRLMDDPDQNIIFENESCYFIQHNLQQDVLVGSGLIIPKKHHEDAFALTEKEWNDTYDLLQKAKGYLDQRFSPDGYTLGWNVGKVSNQEILHSHLHVIPRYSDEPLAGKGIRYWLKQQDNKREKLK